MTTQNVYDITEDRTLMDIIDWLFNRDSEFYPVDLSGDAHYTFDTFIALVIQLSKYCYPNSDLDGSIEVRGKDNKIENVKIRKMVTRLVMDTYVDGVLK